MTQSITTLPCKKNQNQTVQNYQFLQSELSLVDLSTSRHYGSSMPISFLPSGQPRYILGPHYYIFLATLVISTILLIFILISFHSQSAPSLYILGCLILSLFYIYTYIKVGFSNPGLISSGAQPDYETKMHPKYCTPCKIIREKGTKHCFHCDVCIAEYDHHCPWIGKCVGKGNINNFRLFLMAVIGLIVGLFVVAFLGIPRAGKVQIH